MTDHPYDSHPYRPSEEMSRADAEWEFRPSPGHVPVEQFSVRVRDDDGSLVWVNAKLHPWAKDPDRWA